MPNITGQYTFNELCVKAKASAPWVKKVQKMFNLEEGTGVKGVRVYYSEDQVFLHSRIKKLRLLNVEFEEIKHIFNVEKKLLNLAQKTWGPDDQREDVIIIDLIISPSGVCFRPSRAGSKDRESFVMLYREYFGLRDYIKRKRNIMEEIEKEMLYGDKESEENQKKDERRIEELSLAFEEP